MPRPCPSGKHGDKRIHEGSSLLTSSVQKRTATLLYEKERQILAQTRMIHHMSAPERAIGVGWSLKYKACARTTKLYISENTRGKKAYFEEECFDDDDEPIEQIDRGPEESAIDTPAPGCIFALYHVYYNSFGDKIICDKKEFRRHTKGLLGVGPPSVDNSCRKSTRPQWLSSLHLHKRAEAHAEVKALIESWDGEAFTFRRYPRSFKPEAASTTIRYPCIDISVKPIWVARVRQEPLRTEKSHRTTQNKALVL